MYLYTHHITPRLQYVVNFIQQLFTQPVQIVTAIHDVKDNEIIINYSKEVLAVKCFTIHPHALLTESSIQAQAIDCFETNGMKAFFATGGDIPFDIFAASFYLLSRYEEYLPHTPDQFGRYPHQNALAFKEHFLHQPLINTWWTYFTQQVQEKLTVQIAGKNQFTFLPTYDIDIAWSYKNKGFRRNLGGWCKDLLQGKFSLLSKRIAVLRGKQKDPFDAYGWLHQLHEQHRLKPYYFFLLAHHRTQYEKNISPDNKQLIALISDHLIRYPVGIHPSWNSSLDEGVMNREIQTLTQIAGKPVLASRQHYIKFTVPHTYRMLLQQGIRFDFSMGYGSINGFRASVALPFYWYDLEQEQQTELLLFPFCFMDANAYYEQNKTPQDALTEMKSLYKAVKDVNGLFSMIWHNNFVGTDPAFTGWKEVYEQFMQWQAMQHPPVF